MQRGESTYFVHSGRSRLESLKLANSLLFHLVVQWKFLGNFLCLCRLLAPYDVEKISLGVCDCEQLAATWGASHIIDRAGPGKFGRSRSC